MKSIRRWLGRGASGCDGPCPQFIDVPVIFQCLIQYLSVGDICRLSQVCVVANLAANRPEVWTSKFRSDFYPNEDPTKITVYTKDMYQQLYEKLKDSKLIQSLATQQTMESAHIGYGGSSSETFQLAQLCFSNLKGWEYSYWARNSPSPIVRAYALDFMMRNENIDVCTKYDVGVDRMLNDEASVSTLSGCCGGQDSICRMVYQALSRLLKDSNMRRSLDDVMLAAPACSDSTRTSILISRAKANRDDLELHDKIRELASKGAWQSLPCLAGYQCEEDLHIFHDQLQLALSGQQHSRNLFAALCVYPSAQFLPALTQLHENIMSDHECFKAGVYDALCVQPDTDAVVPMLLQFAKVAPQFPVSSYSPKKGAVKAISEALLKMGQHEALLELWQNSDQLSEPIAEFLIQQHPEEMKLHLAASIGFKKTDWKVLDLLTGLLREDNGALESWALRVFQSPLVDCHTMTRYCEWLKGLGISLDPFIPRLEVLSKDWNTMYIGTPAKSMLCYISDQNLNIGSLL